VPSKTMLSARRHLSVLSFVSLVLFAACGATRTVAADATTTIVSLAKIDCADCGEKIVADLRNRPGVYEAQFDRKTAEIKVIASRSYDVFTQVRKLAAEDGFEANLGAGKGRYLEHIPFPEGFDARTVNEEGRDVADLKPLLVPGKITVVDFSASFCGPCREVDKHMASVLATRKDIAYRRVDIGDWDTPVAKHYLTNVPQLPYILVYDAKGAARDNITGLDLQRLDRAIGEGGK